MRFTWALAGVAMALSACSQGPSKAEAETLLLAEETALCRSETIFDNRSFQNGSQRAAGEQAANWLMSTLVTQPGARRLSHQETLGVQTEDKWALAEPQGPATPVRIIINYMMGQRIVIVHGCALEVTGIDILDISKNGNDPKAATVTYRLVGHLTAVGRPISSSPLVNLPGYKPQALDFAREYRAQFRKLDATGWRVESRDLPAPLTR